MAGDLTAPDPAGDGNRRQEIVFIGLDMDQAPCACAWCICVVHVHVHVHVHGAWCMVHGAYVNGACVCCMVHMHVAWCMVHGAWCMCMVYAYGVCIGYAYGVPMVYIWCAEHVHVHHLWSITPPPLTPRHASLLSSTTVSSLMTRCYPTGPKLRIQPSGMPRP